MNELEELKTREANYRLHGHYVDCAIYTRRPGDDLLLFCRCRKRREADFDRVITIAENVIGDEFGGLPSDIRELLTIHRNERDEAIAAAKALREALKGAEVTCEIAEIATPEIDEVLTDTAWLEDA